MEKFTPFTTSNIECGGWLKNQLEIQAQGLSGNLDKVWNDIKNSKWIGGGCEGWERVPYWLDGFVPLAYLRRDEDMIRRVKLYIDAILAGQKEDGWLCPCTDEERAGYDMWALFLIDKVLMLYYDCSGDERVPSAVYKSLINLREHIKSHPLHNWAKSRWFECLIPISALKKIYSEPWLDELAEELKRQGTDFEALFDNWQYKRPRNEWLYDSHVVNMAMAIKEGGVYSSVMGEADDSIPEKMFDMLTKYHGNAVGHFTGDECLAGISPIQGTELCGVVEAMYSYETLFTSTGNNVWADRLEKLSYNALPATITPDMWAHQYCQQTNQISAVRHRDNRNIYRTNSGESGVYGLEPNFGCCTANFNQGWPKFALHSFVHSDDTIAVCAISPASVTAEIGGTSVKIESDTAYPFGDVVNYIVKVDGEAEFTLRLRIPGTAEFGEVDGVRFEAGESVNLTRIWSGRSVVVLKLTFKPKFELRPTGMYTLTRGPLVYALQIGEERTMLEYTRNGVERKFPYCDWEYRPTTEWQYAFAESEPQFHEADELPDCPFDPQTPPSWMDVEVYCIDWGYEEGFGYTARHEPRSTIALDSRPKKVKFIPYGATNIRLTELPFADVR